MSKVSAKSPKTGPEIIDKMQETVTLERFYDRNPWKGDQATYVKQTIERNRKERALFIAKEQSK